MKATRFTAIGAWLGLAVVLAIGGTVACAVPAGPASSDTRRAVAPAPVTTRDLAVDDPTRRPQVTVAPTGRDIFRERAASAEMPPVAPVPFPPRSSLETVSDGDSAVVAQRFVLSGVAEDRAAAAADASRTAIVSGGGDLWLVRRGEMVAGRYRVDRIEADAVYLSDTRGGAPLVLRLR